MYNHREYMKKYYQEHKEEFAKRSKEYYEKNPDYKKKYYEQHKQQISENNRKWREKNRDKFSKLCAESRRRRVEKLKEEGCKNPWNVVVNGAEKKFKEE